MAAPVTTGIEAVDRELRRGPFADAETAKVVANQLLAVWRAMQPGSGDAYGVFTKARHRKQAQGG
jgi:hypothetical protein